MTTVTWTQDGNGNYEVSSTNHLVQLMNQGTLYTDVGSSPVDYWASGSNYKQTADIDLVNVSTYITPIGVSGDGFQGDYDGGEFKISNWSYIDPEFTTVEDCQSNVGLFGFQQSGTLKNIRLAGLYTLQGYTTNAGFLAGYSVLASSIVNIEGDFSTGTFIDNKDGVSGTHLGGIIGYSNQPQEIKGITIRGSLDFRANTHGDEYVGGMIGYSNSPDVVELFQNLATFPMGINGSMAGGIMGRGSLANAHSGYFLQCINAMTGDINGDRFAGGIVGYMALPTSGSNVEAHDLVNSMTGNITFTGASGSAESAGGIFGYVQSNDQISRIYNYMTGSISGVNGGRIGGLIGYYQSSGVAVSIETSLNAMNGTVSNALIGFQSSATTTENLEINTDFGLVFTTDTFETGQSLVSITNALGILSVVEFPDLPYFSLQGTDSAGNSYDFDFVFGNLSGNVSYSKTHLLIRNGEAVFQNGAEFIFSLLTLEERSVNIPVSITEVPGATAYNITYEGPSGGEITAFSGVTTLSHNIVGIDPDTEYTVRLYADTGTGYELSEESTTTTLPNDTSNYDLSEFQDANGVINLTSLPPSTVGYITEIMSGLFTTGDTVNVNINGNRKTSFINLGDTLSIAEINGVLLPFTEAAAAGQLVNVTLSDSTDVAINFDETVNSISVGGVVYYVGDSFVIDGKKATVVDYF